MRPLLAPLALALLAAGTSSCAMLRDWSTYRRIVAHEREHTAVEVVAYDLRVALWEGSVHVVARVTLRNGGDEPLERVRVMLHEEVDLGATRDEDWRELEQQARVQRLGGLATTTLEVRGFEPIAPGAERTLSFDYAIEIDAAEPGLRLDATHGHLLREALWVPAVHTPLAPDGMDRAPMTLTVELAAPLEPVTLFDLELVDAAGADAAPGTVRAWRGTSDFAYAPFLAYGAFTRSASPDGSVVVHELEPGPPHATEFVLEALSELRAHFEQAFGPAGLATTRLAVVRRSGASWGAPCCILLDEAVWPRTPGQEYGTFELVAHELAHTWWGGRVDMHGRGGYLHEGLANWCSADAVRARAGAAAAERAFEVWLIRYARGAHPLGVPLRELSILDAERWQRGAYLVGAHFYRALEQRLGRDAFVALLRAFADEHDGGAADLADLRDLVTRTHGERCDDLFERWVDTRDAGDELHAAGRALIEQRTTYWRERTPDPDPALVARVTAVVDQAFERAAATDIAALAASERHALAPSLFADLDALPELQVTVLDAAGDAVYHSQGLTGDLRGHRDVRGDAVYASILADDAERGTVFNFDFISNDLRRARENAIAWRKLGELAIVVEGHAWRTLE